MTIESGCVGGVQWTAPTSGRQLSVSTTAASSTSPTLTTVPSNSISAGSSASCDITSSSVQAAANYTSMNQKWSNTPTIISVVCQSNTGIT